MSKDSSKFLVIGQTWESPKTKFPNAIVPLRNPADPVPEEMTVAKKLQKAIRDHFEVEKLYL